MENEVDEKKKVIEVEKAGEEVGVVDEEHLRENEGLRVKDELKEKKETEF